MKTKSKISDVINNKRLPLTYLDLIITDADFRDDLPSQEGYPGRITVNLKHRNTESTAIYINYEIYTKSIRKFEKLKNCALKQLFLKTILIYFIVPIFGSVCITYSLAKASSNES